MSIDEIKSTFRGEKDIGEMVKTIGGAAVNVGVDMVVGTLLAAGLNPKKGVKRAVGSLGILILSMKVGDIAEDYFREMVDDLKEAFSAGKKEMQKALMEEANEKKTEENKE